MQGGFATTWRLFAGPVSGTPAGPRCFHADRSGEHPPKSEVTAERCREWFCRRFSKPQSRWVGVFGSIYGRVDGLQLTRCRDGIGVINMGVTSARINHCIGATTTWSERSRMRLPSALPHCTQSSLSLASRMTAPPASRTRRFGSPW